MPKLALDRPFTYELPAGVEAGTGSLVSVPFHGRTVKGWVTGPAADVPSGRLLPVKAVRSPVRYFDLPLLELFRWVGERYLAPLCTVIERSHPPRVAGEDKKIGASPAVADDTLDADAQASAGSTVWHRPLPGHEAEDCADAVAACLDEGRTAIVLVPEAEPLADTASRVLERFGSRACAYLGGSPRLRYRRWLEIAAGRYQVVVGTRPAVFAPLRKPGLIWISREVHPGHREDRSPYYHVREVAAARAGIDGGTCVLSSLSPSAETAAGIAARTVAVRRPPRDVERATAPLVESTPPEAEDRSQRLGRLLREVRSAALIVSRGGYGVARVCRTCTRPAACATCRGPIVSEGGATRCRVCDAAGVCANCGGRSFGVERGGAERIAEWAGHLAAAPVVLDGSETLQSPATDRVLVGTAASIHDVGAPALDLVAILDPDRALARAGVHAAEQAVATWMEAAAWARPKSRGGRVLIQTRHPGHPAIQSLVRWDPMPFLRWELEHRTEAGFPAGHPVFRVAGDASLPQELRATDPTTLLATDGPGEPATICLVVVAPAALPGFRETVLRLARAGVVSRVEAEPQL
ncbi:MAG TPA: hypothetical protein DIU14_08855 [Actinobacteria bacterium]|nr:hypothetical protein [Actinomycetota bacterium]